MKQTFCQVCRHPSPNHWPDCPVLTQAPQRGSGGVYGIPNPQSIQGGQQLQGSGGFSSGPLACPWCGMIGGSHQWAGSGQCPGVQPYGQSDTETRILLYLTEIVRELAEIKKLLHEQRTAL